MSAKNRPAGEWSFTGLDGKVIAEGSSRQCCHCQRTWIYRRKEMRTVGWCPKCTGYICGPACDECIPPERRCENIEAGRPELTPANPMVMVPRSIDG